MFIGTKPPIIVGDMLNLRAIAVDANDRKVYVHNIEVHDDKYVADGEIVDIVEPVYHYRTILSSY